MAVQNYLLRQLEIFPDIRLSEKFIHETPGNIHDYRNTIHPKKRMQRKDSLFQPAFYYQVFQEKYGFVPNLSIIDLLFNEGPNAENILKKSLAPGIINERV
jgi:hypothetical protein